MFLVEDNERELAAAATQFLTKSYTFASRNECVKGAARRSDWSTLAELGWLGMVVPEACGGSDFTAAQLCSVMEAFGAALHLGPVLPVVVEAASLLSRCERSVAVEILLTDLAAGTCRPVFLPIKGLRLSDGKIDGEFSEIQGATSATHFLITLPSENLLSIPVGEGAVVKSRVAIDGSDLGDVQIDTLVASATTLKCPAEGGARSLALSRLAACAWVQGIVEAAIDAAAAYVSMRVQFGQPLAGFQSVRHRLADMRMSADASRASLRRAAVTGDDRAILAAYVVCMETGIFVTEAAIQLHGGMGMTDDLMPSHQYKTVLRLQARYGAPSLAASELGRSWVQNATSRWG